MAFGCYTAENRKTLCTGNSCHCFIGDERCGHGCMATGGSTCLFGLCSDICLGGTKWEYNTGASDYGCTTADGRFQCAYWNGTAATSIACVEKNKGYEYFCGKSCSLDGTGCQHGDCTDVCSDKTYNSVRGTFGRVGGYWGCIYGDVSCHKVSGKYYCYKNGDVCAQNCTNSYPDGTCSMNTCGGTACPQGMTIGADGYCIRADGVYCKLGPDNSGYWCYLSNGELCGKTCNADGTNCTYGCCDGRDGSQCCPSEYSYQKISSYYGHFF